MNSPPHYNVGKIEVIEIIRDWKLDFWIGNVVKYAMRAAHKGRELEDLKKARWYLEDKIAILEGAEGPALGGRLVDDLELSVRAANILASCKIETLSQLTAMTRSEVMKLTHSGMKVVKGIEQELARFGLAFAAEGE